MTDPGLKVTIQQDYFQHQVTVGAAAGGDFFQQQGEQGVGPRSRRKSGEMFKVRMAARIRLEDEKYYIFSKMVWPPLLSYGNLKENSSMRNNGGNGTKHDLFKQLQSVYCSCRLLKTCWFLSVQLYAKELPQYEGVTP